MSLWTTSEAAGALHVGVSSIKRWTDEGVLASVRTPGGHRRYTLGELHRFAQARGLDASLLPPLESVPKARTPRLSLFTALKRGDAEMVRRLVRPRGEELVERAAFFDRVVGDTMREIGTRWQKGQLGVDEEHRASFLVIDAVDRLRPAVTKNAPLALLACPPEELHDLPLRLVRLLLEWGGWRTDLAGASLPWDAARAAVRRDPPALLALTARSGEPFASAEFAQLVRDCHALGTRVVAGGEWARGGTPRVDGWLRFRTLHGFARWLKAQSRDE